MTEIKKVQEELLSLYKVLKKAMLELGIRPIAAYGTALGAMRHQGFIPWDDDVDIMVTRNEYKLLQEKLNDILPEGYEFFHEKNSTEDYPYLFGKFVNKNIVFLENAPFKNNCKYPQHLFIDIFPMDLHKEKKMSKEIFLMRLMKAKIWKTDLKNPAYALFLLTLKFIRLFYRKKSIVKTWEKNLKNNREKAADYKYICQAQELSLPRVSVDEYQKVKKVKFETDSIFVLENHISYLEGVYGDWKKIPSISERQKPHFKKMVILNNPNNI